MTDRASAAFSYAWNWFSVHSSQRMQLVNFWLVAVAFLAAAYVQALSDGLRFVAFGVAIGGVISTWSFWMLDARTRRLIEMSEDALKALEVGLLEDGEPGKGEITLVKHAGGPRLSLFDSYRRVIIALHSSFIVIAAFGAAYAVLAF